jgi:hypothetical protein
VASLIKKTTWPVPQKVLFVRFGLQGTIFLIGEWAVADPALADAERPFVGAAFPVGRLAERAASWPLFGPPK